MKSFLFSWIFFLQVVVIQLDPSLQKKNHWNNNWRGQYKFSPIFLQRLFHNDNNISTIFSYKKKIIKSLSVFKFLFHIVICEHRNATNRNIEFSINEKIPAEHYKQKLKITLKWWGICQFCCSSIKNLKIHGSPANFCVPLYHKYPVLWCK